MLGTAAFAHFHEQLIPLLYQPTNFGQLTLGDWFGTRLAGIIILTVLFGGGTYLIARLWREPAHV
jgi:hypothetical protein